MGDGNKFRKARFPEILCLDIRVQDAGTEVAICRSTFYDCSACGARRPRLFVQHSVMPDWLEIGLVGGSTRIPSERAEALTS